MSDATLPRESVTPPESTDGEAPEVDELRRAVRELGLSQRTVRRIIAVYLEELARDMVVRDEANRGVAADLREQANAMRMDYDGDDVARLARAMRRLVVHD